MNIILVGGMNHGRKMVVHDCRSLRIPVPGLPDWREEEYLATAAVDGDGTRLFATRDIVEKYRHRPHGLWTALRYPGA